MTKPDDTTAAVNVELNTPLLLLWKLLMLILPCGRSICFSSSLLDLLCLLYFLYPFTSAFLRESPDSVGATENSPGCDPGTAIAGAAPIISTLFPFALFHPRDLSASFASTESHSKPNPSTKKVYRRNHLQSANSMVTSKYGPISTKQPTSACHGRGRFGQHGIRRGGRTRSRPTRSRPPGTPSAVPTIQSKSLWHHARAAGLLPRAILTQSRWNGTRGSKSSFQGQ
jgi:hypothetical protein